MTIQEILEAHDDLYFNNQNNKFYCDCGLELGAKSKNYYVMASAHRAHVAEVLEKYMQEREAEAWDEGAEAEASAACMNPPCGACDGCFTPVDNPYKETE